MNPETNYVKTPDGVYIAYQTMGDGPIDIAWQFEWVGNVDMVWEYGPYAEWFRGLASFSRLILHDRRGTGASSRNVTPPNLETRVSDLRAVLDAVGSERTVLAGKMEGGGPNVLLAGSDPERVHSIVWWYPAPRTSRAPDYPFGADDQLLERGSRDIRDTWGTDAYGMTELELVTSESQPFPWGKFSRQTSTPDVALEIDRIYNETDVRGAMPAITAPVLLLAREHDRAALEYYASLLRQPTIQLFPGQEALKVEEIPAVLEAIRRFAGIEVVPELDTVLSTVLFTDVVDSTLKQAAMGDHRYKSMIEQHHAIIRDELQRWRGVEADTAGDGFFSTFDGPARAIRCALLITEKVRELGIEIRAGIHTGECELIDGKIGGITVSIGARVAAKARASEVLVSRTVKDLVAGSGFAFDEAGEHELKGVPGPWRLYRVAG